MREEIIKQLEKLSERELMQLIEFLSTPSEGKMYTILTKAGLAAQANAAISGEKVDFYEMAVGDGNGSYPNLSEDMTELVNETWRGKINHVRSYDESDNHINITTVLPPDTGKQFDIREVGLFDKKGNMLAVGRYPLTWKPSITDGAVKELTINMVLLISNVANIVLKIDPTVIHATQQDLNDLKKEITIILENIEINVEELESEDLETISKKVIPAINELVATNKKIQETLSNKEIIYSDINMKEIVPTKENGTLSIPLGKKPLQRIKLITKQDPRNRFNELIIDIKSNEFIFIVSEGNLNKARILNGEIGVETPTHGDWENLLGGSMLYFKKLEVQKEELQITGYNFHVGPSHLTVIAFMEVE